MKFLLFGSLVEPLQRLGRWGERPREPFFFVPQLGVAARGDGSRGPSPHRQQLAAGFTLIELLVVFAVIGLIAALVLGAMPALVGKRRIAQAQAQMNNVATAIAVY